MKRQSKIPLATSGQNVNVNMLTTPELLKLRRKLAKRINQRMLRLEKKCFTAERGGAYADYQDLLNRFFEHQKNPCVNCNEPFIDELVLSVGLTLDIVERSIEEGYYLQAIELIKNKQEAGGK